MTNDPPVRLVIEPIESANLQKLFTLLDAELSALYPEPGANHFELTAEQVLPGRGTILVAYEGAEPVACGALRRIDDDTAEMKRMYVAPSARKRGVASLIVQQLEREAHRLGIRHLLLETGERQPAAIALAASFGFARIPRFGPYIDSPLSVCMGKSLVTQPETAQSKGP